MAWCGYYLLFGASSIFVLQAVKTQETSLESTHAELVTQRTEIEDRVVRMRPDSLDWDLVDQESRLKLGPPEEARSLKM